MGVKMTGVWTRKPELEFADKQVANNVYSLISRHPYTIATIDVFAKEYAAIFGDGELVILKASLRGGLFDLVMSPTEGWVKGNKVWIPPAPKEEPVLKPGNVWIQGPFGKTQVPEGTQHPQVIVTGFSDEAKQQLGAEVYEHVLLALNAWGSK
jgi:hypothetical protein